MSDVSRINELRALLPVFNDTQPGIDSRKRALAIELLAGPADGWQTDRLARLALMLATKGTLKTQGEPK